MNRGLIIKNEPDNLALLLLFPGFSSPRNLSTQHFNLFPPFPKLPYQIESTSPPQPIPQDYLAPRVLPGSLNIPLISLRNHQPQSRQFSGLCTASWSFDCSGQKRDHCSSEIPSKLRPHCQFHLFSAHFLHWRLLWASSTPRVAQFNSTSPSINKTLLIHLKAQHIVP